MAQRAFVTGGTGFVGINLVRHLVSQGWQVTALHRPQSDRSPLADLDIEWVQGDVTDLRSWSQPLPDRVDAVFHAAGNTRLWARARAEQLKVQVKGTRNVVKAAIEARAGRLIHLSSLAAFGLHGGMISEETPPRGSRSPVHYIRSMALAERELARARSAGLSTVIFNPGHLLGPYDTHNWSRMFHLIRQRRVPAMPPGGASFASVTEAARVMTVAAGLERPGHRYILGGSPTTYAEVLRRMIAAMGLTRRVWSVPVNALRHYAQLEEWAAVAFRREPDFTREAIAFLSGNLYGNSRLAQTDLGYRPVPIDTMIDAAWQWVEEAGLG